MSERRCDAVTGPLVEPLCIHSATEQTLRANAQNHGRQYHDSQAAENRADVAADHDLGAARISEATIRPGIETPETSTSMNELISQGRPRLDRPR